VDEKRSAPEVAHEKGLTRAARETGRGLKGDRATIELDFHDVKERWGAGQQVAAATNIWTNVAVFQIASTRVLAAIDYIHCNPERRGLLDRAIDWQ
jgi:hypothetical protein